MRDIGPFLPDDEEGSPGYSLFWAVEGRGRKSVTLNLRTPEGQDVFRRLAATADVVVENFRPGTLERWNIAPTDLDERLVTVRISTFGQDGPYSERPGLDRVGIGYGGLLHLTGYPDRPPVRVGVTISDYMTGVFAAQAATAALYARDVHRSGKGAVIDAALYGAVLRVLVWTVAASDANFARLCRAMGRAELITDERFARLADRAERSDEINGIVSDWTRAHDAAELETACVAHDVPVATAYTAADMFTDPHFAARPPDPRWS